MANMTRSNNFRQAEAVRSDTSDWNEIVYEFFPLYIKTNQNLYLDSFDAKPEQMKVHI